MLTKQQDALMNGIVSNAESLATGVDVGSGEILKREHMLGLAGHVRDDLNTLWNEIAFPHLAPYLPCPWGKDHPVGSFGNDAGMQKVGCLKSSCPMHRNPMSMIEWNYRG